METVYMKEGFGDLRSIYIFMLDKDQTERGDPAGMASSTGLRKTGCFECCCLLSGLHRRMLHFDFKM